MKYVRNLEEKLKFKSLKIMLVYPKEIFPTSGRTSVNLERNKRKSEHKDNPLQYFKVFFKFGYALFYTPYKLVFIENGRFYVSKTSRFHKTVCGVMYILSALRFTMAIREVTVPYTKANPVLYFEVCRTVLTLTYMGVYKWAIWKRERLFLSIVNELADHKLLQNDINFASSTKKIKIEWIANIICFVYAAIPFISIILGSKAMELINWNLSSLLESYAGMARYSFLIQPHPQPLPFGEFNWATYPLVVLYILMNFYYFLGGHFFDLSVLMGALTLRHLAKSFARCVENTQDPYYINQIMDQYSALKKLSTKINGAIGCVTFCFVIEALPYYATHLDDILTLEDWYSKFRYIFFFCNFFSILVIASDIVRQVETFRVWISRGDNCMLVNNSKLVVLMNELSGYPIGLKVGGIVTISYGFVGTMISVVVTYAVIILQFNFTSIQTCPVCSETEQTPTNSKKF